MFGFLRKAGMRSPSDATLRALAADGLPPGTNVAGLGVVESRGTYAGREVTLIRVFDPARAVRRSVDVLSGHAYDDLNAHPDLVLRGGYIRPDGTVVLTSRANGPRPSAQATTVA